MPPRKQPAPVKPTPEVQAQAYKDQRAAEQRANCTSCGMSDLVCTNAILSGSGKACCEQCGINDTHPAPEHDNRQYATQTSMHFTPADARKLAIELLSAAERCKRPDMYVRVHSFGHAASAWMVENFTCSPM